MTLHTSMARLRMAVAVVVLAALAVGLSGCSSSGAKGVSANEPQTLLIWDTGLLAKTNDNGTAKSDSFLHQAAKNFEVTHKNITVKIVEQGGDISANAAQFKAASIAGNGPDMRIQYTGGPTLSFSKYFVDLNDVLGKDTLSQFNGLNTVRKDYDPNGSLLALPYGSGTYFTLWYNKRLLKQAGLDPNYRPSSWQDLISEGKKYHDATGKPAFYVADLEGYVGAWVVAALAAGDLGAPAYTDMYAGKTKIDGPAMLKAYTTWSELFGTGLTNKDAGEVSNGDADQGFIQGKAPIYFSGTWADVGMYQKFKNTIGWSFIPMEEGAKYSDVAAGGPQVAISITRYSKHQAAAAEFLKYLARPKTQDLYVKLTQTEGSSNKQGDTSVIKNPLLKEQAEALKSTSTIVYPFDNVMPQSVIDPFYRMNAATFLGKTTPKSAVQQLQSALDAEQG
jgi:ABC-type glycerol-3-phosphate transport system substrate-binding protein